MSSNTESLKDMLNRSDELSGSISDTNLSELVANLTELERLQRDKLVNIGALNEFLGKPYIVLSQNRELVKIAVPRFIEGFHPGWLVEQRGMFNVYELTRWMKWIGGVEWSEKYPMPPEVERMLKFEPDIALRVEDHRLVGQTEYDSQIRKRYGSFLVRRESPGVYLIKGGRKWFDLIAALIDDGILPYVPRPVKIEDRRQPRVKPEFALRPYQQETFDRFLEYGAIGAFWPFAAGKTFLGLYALASLKGKKKVVVPTRTLVEQWHKRLKDYTTVPEEEVDILTYHSFNKPEVNEEHTLTIFDECHRLPADMFSILGAKPTKYRIGLSGSPYREDGRTNYIIALTGYPTGLNWEDLHKLGVFEYPDVNAYVVWSREEKVRKLKELLGEGDGKTIVFCDGIEFGKSLSEEFDIPFVYGNTTNRLETIGDNKVVIVSRVGDEGLSLDDIERVIEVDFHGGSRRQEIQRVGRLFHGTGEYKGRGKHTVLMTQNEYNRFERRFYGLTEKGVKVRVSYL